MNVDGKKISGNNFNMQEILPLAGPKGTTGVRCTSRNTMPGVTISAEMAKKPYFDRFIKFVDWLYYSDEGIELTTMGVEGETYTIENGEYKRPADFMKWDNPNGTKLANKDYGLLDTNIRLVTLSKYSPLLDGPKYNEYLDTLNKNKWIPQASPNLRFKDEDKERWKMLTQVLNDYREQSFFKFIYGEKSLDTDWNSYVAEFESKGSKELMEIVDKTWKNQNQ
jgi:putative aldouronate transport system substrate-binding protein